MAKKKIIKGTDQTKCNILVIQPTDTSNESRFKINHNFEMLAPQGRAEVPPGLFQRTLFHFGHPVVKVELTEEHMENAMAMATSTFSLHTFDEITPRLAAIKSSWINNYAIALMGETLVNIRGKFSELPKTGGVSLNTEALWQFTLEEKHRLFKLLMEAAGRN